MLHDKESIFSPGSAPNGMSVKQQGSGLFFPQAADDLGECCLSGTVLSGDGDNFAAGGMEREPIQDLFLSIRKAQMLNNQQWFRSVRAEPVARLEQRHPAGTKAESDRV
jgi:hypothetical protein